MGFSYNDIATRAYSVSVADGDAVAGPCRVFKVWINGVLDGTVTINNAATKAGGGTSIALSMDVSASVTPTLFDFGPNGILFATGLSMTITANVTGGVAYMAE